MLFFKQGSLLLGPGGRLPDVPENHALLTRLQETPELTSEELLRLAEFYKRYPTNAALGNHLALVALTRQERHRGANGYRALQKIVLGEHLEIADLSESHAEVTDGISPAREGTPNEEAHEDLDDFRLFIRHLPAEGLLVETLSGKAAGQDVNYHFIIGFSPAPAALKHE